MRIFGGEGDQRIGVAGDVHDPDRIGGDGGAEVIAFMPEIAGPFQVWLRIDHDTVPDRSIRGSEPDHDPSW